MRRYSIELRSGTVKTITCDDCKVKRNAINFFVDNGDDGDFTVAVIPLDLVKWVESDVAPGDAHR